MGVIPKNISLGSQAISIWCHAKEYLDNQGLPAPLPRHDPGDGSASFESLIRSISKDIRPRPLLDEWLRIGIVELIDNNSVKLKSEALVPANGYEEKLYYLGRNLQDHIAACEHNMQDDHPPFIERSVHYSSLPGEAVDIIQARAEKLGMKTLKELNQMILQLQNKYPPESPGRERMNFGIYFYRDAAEKEDKNP